MSNLIDSKLGFGPMSPEVIEGIIKASSVLKLPLMLIATRNQVNYDGGYVNNWNTKQYVEFIKETCKKYEGSKIYVCRDHCGPGFSSGDNSVDSVYKTIQDDLENDFDLIHIDFSKIDKNKQVVLAETRKVVKWILSLGKKISIEIGTEENKGTFKSDLEEIENELKFVLEFVEPEFFVVQSGSLIMEIYQEGDFNKEFIARVHDFLSANRVKLKEHNLDYTDYGKVKERRGIVEAMNIAPSLGVNQTLGVIREALVYGIDIYAFLEKCYTSKTWEKWLLNNTSGNKMLCSLIAGHYNFTSDEYKELISRLEKYIDISGLIIDKTVQIVKNYSDAFIS
jgi:hypothetical protein